MARAAAHHSMPFARMPTLRGLEVELGRGPALLCSPSGGVGTAVRIWYGTWYGTAWSCGVARYVML